MIIVRLPLLSSGGITPQLLGMPFFDTFMEHMGYEFLQHTFSVKPWVIW